ncbi:helix-turn-helix transcriptional regulator [Variovorax guangxiensis]|uniref:helix-turn-helix domain-containing protein n=1 Tax=Variovorax guangxiensis TaxID=1775474 RepID=UPI00286D40A0|nr:helix-turn-helix transcriptional regulator [Variovorax guangxiensis]
MGHAGLIIAIARPAVVREHCHPVRFDSGVPPSRARKSWSCSTSPRPFLPSSHRSSQPLLDLGGRLTALRVAAGLSGGELARRSRISRSMLSRVEHGLVTPSIGTLARLHRRSSCRSPPCFTTTSTLGDSAGHRC